MSAMIDKLDFSPSLPSFPSSLQRSYNANRQLGGRETGSRGIFVGSIFYIWNILTRRFIALSTMG